MARTGRPTAELNLSDEEREQLSRWARRRKSSQALALRSRIVLACAEGMANKDVAVLVGCSAPTVTKWRSRFVQHRLDGLSDDPRPGRPATITTEQVEDIVVATLESTPENATHWSRSKMAERAGLSKSRPCPGHSRLSAMMPGMPEKRTHDYARHHKPVRGNERL